MKKNMNRKLLDTVSIIMLVIVVMIVGIFFYYIRNKKRLEYFENMNDIYIKGDSIVKHTSIPKLIWTFWDNPDSIPDIISKCINTFKVHNPDYEVIVLHKNNLDIYLPEVNFDNIKHIKNQPARFSDMVRLHILAKNGGIWCDASIICLESFEWIQQIIKNNKCEFVGFYINGFTFHEYIHYSPVIESWFLACVKDSKFMNDWKNEFLKISNFNTVKEYIENVKDNNISIQNITIPEYLSIHVSAQVILQKNINTYNLYVIRAEDTAFKYLVDNNWNQDIATDYLLNNFDNINKQKIHIIKLRGGDRKRLMNKDYNKLFN